MKRILSTSILCLTIGLTTAACGGSDESPIAASAATQGQQQAGGRSPGGSGEVTEVSGSTAQVKGQDSQVAVSWTDETTFTQQVTAAAKDVVVGSCVMVTPADTDSTSEDAVTARSVRITAATDDGCSPMGGMGGGRGGERPEGAPEGMPEGGRPPAGERPTDRPSDAPDGGRGQRGGFAIGEVTAVTATGFTVSSQQPGADSEATTVDVTTSGDTIYTTTADASADDVLVGVCVTSRGEADDTGAITASSIAITEAVEGACTTGFGGMGGRPGGRGGDASGEGAASGDAA